MAPKLNPEIFLMVLLVLVAVCCVAPAAVNPALCTPANGRCTAPINTCCYYYYCHTNTSINSGSGICLFCGYGGARSYHALCGNNGDYFYRSANRTAAAADNSAFFGVGIVIIFIIFALIIADIVIRACTGCK
jgi:hypothetical protein